MTFVNVSLGETVPVIPRTEAKEMMSVGVTPEGKTLVRINSSSISIIQECLRKAQYSLEEKWKSEHEHPGNLFGSAVHTALEIYYKGSPDQRIMPTWDDCERLSFGQPIVTQNLIIEAMKGFIQKAQPLKDLPDTDKRSIPNGIWILYNYFKAHLNDPYVAHVDKDGPFIERTFTYRLHEDDKLAVDLFGTIDFVFRHITDGGYLPGDHKTSSALSFNGSSYFDRERPNHQYTAYSLAANEVFGLKTSDFMVNVIEVKAKPKTARGSVPNFPRQITRRDADDYAEFKQVVMKVVRDYLYAKEHSEWPLGPVSSCNLYGSCSFKSVCSAPKSIRHNVLTSKFIQQGNNNDNTSGHQTV